MKIGMMLGFEDSIKTIPTIGQEAERSGIHSLYTVDAGRSATIGPGALHKLNPTTLRLIVG